MGCTLYTKIWSILLKKSKFLTLYVTYTYSFNKTEKLLQLNSLETVCINILVLHFVENGRYEYCYNEFEYWQNWLLALSLCLKIIWTMLLITGFCFLRCLEFIHTERNCQMKFCYLDSELWNWCRRTDDF